MCKCAFVFSKVKTQLGDGVHKALKLTNVKNNLHPEFALAFCNMLKAVFNYNLLRCARTKKDSHLNKEELGTH